MVIFNSYVKLPESIFSPDILDRRPLFAVPGLEPPVRFRVARAASFAKPSGSFQGLRRSAVETATPEMAVKAKMLGKCWEKPLVIRR